MCFSLLVSLRLSDYAVMSTVIVTECESNPLAPVTVIVYEPIGVLCNALMLSVDVPWPPEVRVTDELLNDVLGPDVGETVAERLMVPVNPFRLVTVIRLLPDVPRGRLKEDGLTDMEKSDTMTRIETECASDPLVAVRVDVPEEPASMLTVGPPEASVKSTACETVRARLTECERLPLVPVTKTV